VTRRWSDGQRQAAAFITASVILGAVLGLLVVLLRH
jgi:hypothetical protein